MEQTEKFTYKLKLLQNAYQSLENVLKKKNNEFIRDSTIKRFEYTIELVWKTLKEYLLYLQIDLYTPRDILKESFRIGIISDLDLFLKMVENRNKSAHVYNEKDINNIYGFIKNNYYYIGKLINLLKSKI